MQTRDSTHRHRIMILPSLLALVTAGFLFVVSFGLLALIQPAAPTGTLLIVASSGAAAAAVAFFHRTRWLTVGFASGAVAAAYFLLVYFTLLRRGEPDIWPLFDALLTVGVALLAARLAIIGRKETV